MAYIQPNTEVHILRRVPLDRDYKNTYLPPDKDQQFAQFTAYQKFVFYRYSYQRTTRQSIRVEKKADELYDCNYMCFQNTAYGNKWFYAFIDDVEYINDNTSAIYYTIDVIQTWWFDFTMRRSFVEREHTLTDELGEHLIPENVSGGDLIIRSEDYYYFQSPNRFYIVIYYVPNQYIYTMDSSGIISKADVTVSTHTGVIENGIYMGARFVAVQMNDGSNQSVSITELYASALIREMIGDGCNIVNIVQVPKDIWENGTQRGGLNTTKSITQPATFKSPDGTLTYTPKNKKLYTSPYQKLVVVNNEGNASELKWEWFSNGTTTKTAEFQIQGVVAPMPLCMATPKDYRGVNFDYDSGITITDFPECSWSEDSYTKWWVQNKNSYTASMQAIGIRQALGLLRTAITPAANQGLFAVNMAQEGLQMLNQQLQANQLNAQKADMQATPDNLAGQLNTNSLKVLQNRYGFRFYSMAITEDNAKAVDNYFDLYGYACNLVKMPNVILYKTNISLLRPYWNFIKTVGANIVPVATVGNGLPQDQMALISKIFDRGITFWNSMSYLGDYSRNNSPL